MGGKRVLGPSSMLGVGEDAAYPSAGPSRRLRASSYSSFQTCSQPPPPGSLPCCPSVLLALFLLLAVGRLNLQKEGSFWVQHTFMSQHLPQGREQRTLDSRSLRFVSWSVLGKLSWIKRKDSKVLSKNVKFSSVGQRRSPWTCGTGAGGSRKRKRVCGYGTQRPSSSLCIGCKPASNLLGLGVLTCDMERISPALTNSPGLF